MIPGVAAGGGPSSPEGLALARRLPPLVARLRGPELDDLAQRLSTASPTGLLPEPQRDPDDDESPTRVGPPGAAATQLADVLTSEGLRAVEARREAERDRTGFLKAIRRAPDALALQAQLRHHLRTTRSGWALRRDLNALRRWLDADALVERMEADIVALGVELELICRLLEGLPLREQGVGLLRVLVDDPNLPTRRAAVHTLSSWVVERIRGQGLRAVPSELLRQVLQIARQRQGDALTARRALKVLLVVAPEEQEAMLLERLTPPERQPATPGRPSIAAWARDDFLVRAEAARLSQLAPDTTARRAYTLARRDPSETVRCALADGLARRDDVGSLIQLERLAREDPALAVRLHARTRLGERRGEGDPHAVPVPSEIEAATLDAESPADAALVDLAEDLAGLAAGRSRTVELPPGSEPVDLARALLPWAIYDHGFGLKPRAGDRVRVSRGYQAIPRAWRMVHELRTPGPAKRQVGDHISGETMRGPLRVPPARMAEVSATGVPNQRVISSAWGSWAPWLPQPEDFLDSLGTGTTRVVTAEGVTTIRAPRNPLRRAWAAIRFTWSMSRLDRQRQLALASPHAVERAYYLGRMAHLGFETSFEGHEDRPQHYAGMHQYFELPEPGEHGPDPGSSSPGIRVLGLGGPALLETLRSLIGVRHNLPSELATVCIVIAAVFFGRLALFLHRTRSARRRLPLVVGGWGTRGKSGTERLKAAVFQGLGYDSICKTTGCEAMLLHAPPGGHSRELFLYRPYERATIWEHADTLQLASRLGSPVFLWECMALRPDYVEQLQLQWTRDDLATITNTYPDHEDVQGPTGLHVAETISSFIPRNSLLITSETQMLPVLRDRCQQRGTALMALTDEHVASQPADLLARLPYQEHPANVALVARMAAALGLDPEEAIVLMADHVIPDLGALATFGPMRHRGRVLEFTNGMSANERAGFLNNWTRSGFADHDRRNQADTFIVTVVNNRRDRNPRSRVFAEILANDAAAHRHVLIGNNLEGLRSYLDKALDGRIARIDPFAGGAHAVEDRLEELADQLRLVAPGPLLRGTGAALGVPRAMAERVAAQLDSAIASAPTEPISLAEARERLSSLRQHLEAMAQASSGVFERDNDPSPGSVHPRMGKPLFHDEEDYAAGSDDLVEHWLQVASEALAFEALKRACLGVHPAPEPPPTPPTRPPAGVEAEEEATDLLTDLASADEAAFWADDHDDVIATLDADGLGPGATDPGLDDETPYLAPPEVIVEGLPEPRRATPVDPEQAAPLVHAARRLFRAIFIAHLVTVPDPKASGDQIIDTVARSCPGGVRVRTMGIQNIKGTGLDLVYRWVHAAQPLRLSEDLFHPERSVRMAALARLERWREWSIPACQEVLRALRCMSGDSANAQARSELSSAIDAELARRRQALATRQATFSPGAWIKEGLWSLWDPFDAIIRRWRSDRIWSDLTNQRISHDRAARELARIAVRQRGDDSPDDPAMLP